LVPMGDASGLGGATPKQIVQDALGRKYLAKTGDAKAVAEDLALQLRKRVGYPAAPVVTHEVTMADGQAVPMRIKPLLANEGNLHGEPTQWPKTYQDTLMEDYAFAQVLGNFDLKKGQYIVLDTAKGKQILNTDWDNTLRDYAQNVPLNRYKAHTQGTLSPPAQSMLFESYVNGRQNLDFKPLWSAIERIQNANDEDLLTRLTPAQAAEYRARKTDLKTTFTTFVEGLNAERSKNLGQSPENRSLTERMGSQMKDTKLRATAYLTSETPYLIWKNRLVKPFKKN
jgi:hypothetical protein